MSSTPRRTLITAALPYANGPLHIGHFAGVYMPSDMYARFKRLRGEKVLFICGSDEHGVPITISADREKVSPQVIVDRFHELNKSTFEKLRISFDYYARTSSAVHKQTSQDFFRELNDNGYLIAREEPQLYDEEAKTFLPDRYVEGTCPVCSNPEARGDQCDRCGTYLNQTELINPRSKITGNKPIVRPTKHWYFALSKFQKALEAYLEAHKDVWRDAVIQAARSWLKTGLQDRPITRDLEWGVPVPLPNAEGKVLYVWFDAPIGYISATKEALDKSNNPNIPFDDASDLDWRTWWQDTSTDWSCFLGKDNIVFHVILFPAMLMAYNNGKSERKFNLPANIPANEFMNLEGRKLSKSKGWMVELHELTERYPTDVIRYTFATLLPEQKDSEFSWKDLQSHTNNELADIFGNLVNRVFTFVKNNFEGVVPGSQGDHGAKGDELLALFETKSKSIAALYERFKLRDAAQATMDLARAANKYFNDEQPWKLIKTDREAAAKVMRTCLEAIRSLSIYFSPILPETAERIAQMLNIETNSISWDDATKPSLKNNHALGEVSILFQKIEDETVTKELERIQTMAAKAEAMSQTIGPITAIGPTTNGTAAITENGIITIDDFKKIKLRTAIVLEAERVPKSKKLLKLQIDLGDEKRQIVAGIGAKYSPEEMIGRSIVVVANLAPAKLMGNESNGMLLAVNDADGIVALLNPDAETKPGLEVR